MSTPEPKDPDIARAAVDKAKAEAESAKIKARTEERLEQEAAEPSAKAVRDAERGQKIAEAEKDRAAAQREQITALVPSFKDVGRGDLEDKSEQPMFEAALAQRALARAASNVAAEVETKLPDDWRVLITSDSELVTSDGTYHEVVAALRQLTLAAEEVLRNPDPVAPNDAEADLNETEAGLHALLAFAPVLVPAVSALAGMLPALLGVFSAHRTLKSAEVGKNDLAASASVAAALTGIAGGEVALDNFRLLPTDGVHRMHAKLVTLRRQLTVLKLRLENEQSSANQPLAAESDQETKHRMVRLGLVDSVASAIDTFNVSLVAMPTGGTRSPLSVAATREQLHTEIGVTSANIFTHVLLVKSEGGSVHQTIDDKPFMMSDKLSIVASASLTWLLLATDTNAIVGAGTAGGIATAYGAIGDRLQLGFDEGDA